MPSTVCGVCQSEFSSASGVINCAGDCGRSFHQQCVKDSVDEKKTRAAKAWKCRDCRGTSSNAGSVQSTVSTPLTKDWMLSVLENLKKEVFKEMQIFREEVAEMKIAMNAFSDIVDKSNQLMSEVKKDLSALRKENEALRNKNADLDATVCDLQDRVRALEQYTRRSNIEVSGIPVTPQENVMDIVRDLGSAIGVRMEECTVTAAHRVPSYKKERTPSLVVQFSTRAERDLWISKYKENKGLTADKVNKVFPKTQKVYVNEHLSPDNKLFLFRLKKRCQEIGYSYVWCRGGKFFVRKNSGDKCVRVDTVAEINKLK